MHPRSLTLAQGEARVSDLHQQRIAAKRPARNHTHRLAIDEAKFAQTPRDDIADMGIFNAMHQTGKQIVLTSDAPAAEVKSLSDRLVSRFSWGLTVDIQPPNRDTREAILRKLADCNTGVTMLYPKPSGMRLAFDESYIMASLGVLAKTNPQAAKALLTSTLRFQ